MFVGESGSGHTVVMDGPEDLGGTQPRAAAHGDAAAGHRRLRHVRRDQHAEEGAAGTVRDCRVESRRARRRGAGGVHALNLHFVVSGEDLKENHVKRAVELSAEKYCSASIMLEAAGVEADDTQLRGSRTKGRPEG
jgi:putative redox protein